MRYRRSDIVERAVGILDLYGLPDLSMRRLATELGLQPSALYHHFASKQELLAAVSDELLRRGRGLAGDGGDWRGTAAAACHALRDAMLAYRDGAELVATVHAFGLGARRPLEGLVDALAVDGLDPAVAADATTTMLYFVLGHVVDEQTTLQAGSAGAIDDEPLDDRHVASFDRGLEIILDGIAARSVRTADR